MEQDRILQELLPRPLAADSCAVAAVHISRQAWQVLVEELVVELRKTYRRPAFGLSDAEVSVHYHRPIKDFAELLRTKLA